MLKELKYKNEVIPGYFISDEGKIYDAEGVEQKQYLNEGYYCFKNHKVHAMIAHSFYEYKKGFDVHHLNQVKTDNRLQNLVYLTHAEHTILHNIGKKFSEQSKAKMSASRKDRKQVYCAELNKVFAGVHIAARELSLVQGNISKCCQGKLKTTGGYHFEFYTGEQNEDKALL